MNRDFNEKKALAKNGPIIKNLQFYYNQSEIWAKSLTHGLVILTKFHYNWAKIVDFLLLNIFWARVIFFVTVSMLHSLNYLNLRLFRMFEACLDIDLYEKAAFLT